MTRNKNYVFFFIIFLYIQNNFYFIINSINKQIYFLVEDNLKYFLGAEHIT